MKKSGLRNRFPSSVRTEWMYWYSCLVCHRNQWEVLHHIMSPSSHDYIDGEHNESILNSCPIHNYKHPQAEGSEPNCHIGNDGWLHQQENASMLLHRTREALVDLGYQLKPIDMLFLKTYKKMYGLRC